MKFGKIGATVALSAAVVTGTLLGAAPANALTVGETLVFSTDENAAPNNLAKLTNTGGNLFDFDIGVIEIDAAGAFGGAGTVIADTVLKLQQIGASTPTSATYQLVSSPAPWFSGLDDGLGGDSRTFTLTSFILKRQSAISATGAFQFTAGFNGYFEPPTPGLPALGGFGGRGRLATAGAAVAGSAEVVPTPAAVLPALLGMGAAALRKKKGEEAEA
jgi:hypothetical protein